MKQGFPPLGNYKVMVQCITYNQSKYIEDTLIGFAKQQTNFPFICCVFDDASTDGEQEVLNTWIDSHCNPEDVDKYDHPLAIILMAPDKNNPNCIYAMHLQKVNTWGKPEKQEMIAYWEKQCEYIALCEGDDYWVNSNKLQDQVDYLDIHADYGMVYSKARKYIEEKAKFGSVIGRKMRGNDYLILHENPIPTLTVMLRSEYSINYYLIESKHYLMGDLPLWLYISKNTKVGFINTVTSVYRVLINSATGRSSFEKRELFIKSSYDIRFKYANENQAYMIRRNLYISLLSNAYIYKKYCDVCRYYQLIPNPTFKCLIKYLYSIFQIKFIHLKTIKSN